MPSEPDKQGLLFATERPTPRAPLPEPGCHSQDAVTSFQAAEDLKQSGKHRKHLWRTYFAVVRHPGRTGPELAKLAGFTDRFQALRRLSDLKNMGLICVGGRRVCEVRRRKCSTWFASKAWPSRGRKSRAPEPCERPTEATESGPGSTTPTSGRSSTTGGPGSLGPMPGRVMSISERRAMRERLAAEGDDRTKAFLRGVD